MQQSQASYDNYFSNPDNLNSLDSKSSDPWKCISPILATENFIVIHHHK